MVCNCGKGLPVSDEHKSASCPSERDVQTEFTLVREGQKPAAVVGVRSNEGDNNGLSFRPMETIDCVDLDVAAAVDSPVV